MAIVWYALHVKPHKERFVYERLQNLEHYSGQANIADAAQQIQPFFPAVRVKPVNPRSAKVRPYFPGYIFVRGDLELLGENAFIWIPGTHGLVRFGDMPAAVPDVLIRELRERLAEIEAAGGLVFDALKPGDLVRITSGPLAGYEAIFDMRLPGKERVQVLLASAPATHSVSSLKSVTWKRSKRLAKSSP